MLVYWGDGRYARERYLVHQSKMTTDLFTELQRKHQNRYEDPRYGGRGGGGGGGGLIAPMLQQSNVPRLPVYYGGGRGLVWCALWSSYDDYGRYEPIYLKGSRSGRRIRM